eukprot:SM000147S01109  [mRNA]  locus=s147:95508:100407:+ [translate_table: standard]
MPPNLDFQDWCAAAAATKEALPPRPIMVKVDKAAYAMPELDTSLIPALPEIGERKRNAKQLTWVLLLKAHKAAGCIAWLGVGLVTFLTAVRHRLLTKQGLGKTVGGGDSKPRSRLLRVLRIFLLVVLGFFVFEAVAHAFGWQHHVPQFHRLSTVGFYNLLHWSYLSWVSFRKKYIAPPLQFFANTCTYLFIFQSIDRVVLSLGCFWIRLRGLRPQPKVELEEAGADLERALDHYYPMVLIQVPMCNERECYEQAITAACQMDWPKTRMLVQVLDDSDDVTIQKLIRGEVQKWLQKGSPITYRHRLLRRGYKAGNLQSAMNCDYVKDYEFVAIFDADFQPKPDFLTKTILHFKEQPDLALVQARWSFINKDENLLTRLQNINLSFHFEVEQQVNGTFINFFGFNGTAGVWRIAALENSGGWLDRTTVEDMDIAVRAHLKGWKFIFLNDVEALCELPESYEAYRKQQHRWHSGPMQLFRLCLPDIITAKVALWKKFNMIFLFFLLRKMILPFYSFTLFCIILPLTMFVPEASLPLWVVCYIPGAMSILNVIPSPRSFPFLVPYLLFENTMSVTKFQAMISGLFQLNSASEWVVTKKTGRSSEADLLAVVREVKAENGPPLPSHARAASETCLDSLKEQQSALQVAAESPKLKLKPKRTVQRMYRKELALALLLLVAAARSLMSERGMHFYFLLFQGLAFLVVGLDLIGEPQKV